MCCEEVEVVVVLVVFVDGDFFVEDIFDSGFVDVLESCEE